MVVGSSPSLYMFLSRREGCFCYYGGMLVCGSVCVQYGLDW